MKFKFSLLVCALSLSNISFANQYFYNNYVGDVIGKEIISTEDSNFYGNLVLEKSTTFNAVSKDQNTYGVKSTGLYGQIILNDERSLLYINSLSELGSAYGIKSDALKQISISDIKFYYPNKIENALEINVKGGIDKKSAAISAENDAASFSIYLPKRGLKITANNADGIVVKSQNHDFQSKFLDIRLTSDQKETVKRTAIYADGVMPINEAPFYNGSFQLKNDYTNIESSGNAIYLKNGVRFELDVPTDKKITGMRYRIIGDTILENKSALDLFGIDYLKTNITKITDSKADIILSKGGNNWKSQWDITGNSNVNNLELNNSVVQFMNKPVPVNTMARLSSNAGFYTLNIEEKLTVNGGGTFILNTNGVSSDHIYVKEMEGKAQLFVKDNGSANATADSQLVLAKIDIKDADSGFIVNDFEAGGYQFSAKEVNGEYVANTNGRSHGSVLSSSANVAANSMVGNYLTNLVETKNILNRVSDIRNDKADNNLWIRGYNGKINAFESGMLSGFDMKYNALQIGWDNKLSTNTQGNFYLGAAVGYTYGDQDHDFGSAKMKSYNASLYGSYMTEDHLYADVVLKYARLNNDFKVTSLGGNSVKGDTKTNSYSLSAGVGKRIYLSSKDQGWFIEPQAQLTATHIDAASYRASNGLRVKLDSQNSTLGRFGGSVGYDINQSNLPTTIYAKAALVREFAGGADYYLNNAKEHHSFKGSWGQYGIGVSTNFTPNQQLYVDFEADRGGRFKQRQLNMGYSLSF